MVFDANKQLSEFASDYLKLAGESHAYTQKYGYSNINISTMTLVSKTNMDDINMEMIAITPEAKKKGLNPNLNKGLVEYSWF
jgi:hypothetical protein